MYNLRIQFHSIQLSAVKYTFLDKYSDEYEYSDETSRDETSMILQGNNSWEITLGQKFKRKDTRKRLHFLYCETRNVGMMLIHWRPRGIDFMRVVTNVFRVRIHAKFSGWRVLAAEIGDRSTDSWQQHDFGRVVSQRGQFSEVKRGGYRRNCWEWVIFVPPFWTGRELFI